MERLLQTQGLRVDGVDTVMDMIPGHLVCSDRALSTGQPALSRIHRGTDVAQGYWPA